MGFRYRKSINLGGGFRINLSKSGIGYSWGTKGLRVTKTAKGTTRTTYSIPGTGISYTDDSGRGRRQSAARRQGSVQNRNRSSQSVFQATASPAFERAIESAEIEQFKNAEEGSISNAIERTIRLNWIGTLLLWGIILVSANPILVFLPVIGIALKVMAHTAGRVNLEYTFDAEKEEEHTRRVDAWQLLADGNKEWQILSEQYNTNTKVNAGAARNIKRVACKIRRGRPFYISTNVETIEILLSKKETLVILPDKVFFIRKRKVGMIDYSDFEIAVSSVRFVETGPVPKDAQVVGQTWQYVNKNGTPDKRFKNNRQIPVCLYGRVLLRSNSGLNVELQISNIQNTRDFDDLIK